MLKSTTTTAMTGLAPLARETRKWAEMEDDDDDESELNDFLITRNADGTQTRTYYTGDKEKYKKEQVVRILYVKSSTPKAAILRNQTLSPFGLQAVDKNSEEFRKYNVNTSSVENTFRAPRTLGVLAQDAAEDMMDLEINANGNGGNATMANIVSSSGGLSTAEATLVKRPLQDLGKLFDVVSNTDLDTTLELPTCLALPTSSASGIGGGAGAIREAAPAPSSMMGGPSSSLGGMGMRGSSNMMDGGGIGGGMGGGMGGGGYQREEYTVRVTNLTEYVTEAELRSMFSCAGTVTRCKVPTLLDKGRTLSRGYAFISYGRLTDAEQAIALFDHSGYQHLLLHVEWAQPQQRR